MGAGKTNFQCGHRGWGSYCHRCKHAEGLKDLAAKTPPGEDQKWLIAESARLFAPAVRKTRVQAPVIE